MPHRSMVPTIFERASGPGYDAAPDMDAGDALELRRMQPIFCGFRHRDR
jgi:hypothetical protein